MIIFGVILILIFLVFLIALIIFHLVHRRSNQVVPEVVKGHPLYQDGQKFMNLVKNGEEWTSTTFDGLNLTAWYVAAEQPTNKTIIVANGYRTPRDRTAGVDYLFHQLGYNVLVPAYRGSNESEGRYIGFGWLDRYDYLQWIEQIIEKNPTAEIAMMGISMGGATTMMVSGENLPENVKCFIDDCGYDTLWNEIVFKAKHDYHLPAFPFVYLMSFWSKLLAGYSYKEVSALKQLSKNTRPILFIHGDKDEFVPTEMVYHNFEATSSIKELVIVKGAEHAIAYETNIPLYRDRVTEFLGKYL